MKKLILITLIAFVILGCKGEPKQPRTICINNVCGLLFPPTVKVDTIYIIHQ